MSPLVAFLIGVALVAAAAILRQRLMSFEAQRVEDYAADGPEFDLREHLSGPIACEGVIYGPTGRVAARFEADMHGSWEGNSGRLAERFHYSTGAIQDREWRIELGREGRFTTYADDVVGAGEGRHAGPGVRLTYRLRLPDASGGHVLEATDWMYLVADGVIVNHSQFRKFGLPVAELIATLRQTGKLPGQFRKRGHGRRAEAAG